MTAKKQSAKAEVLEKVEPSMGTESSGLNLNEAVVKENIKVELGAKESPSTRVETGDPSDGLITRATVNEFSKPKTMGNTGQNKCRENVSDVVIFGEDLFKLLSKASSESEGWMKSTKAFETGKGCVVQVTTQQRNRDWSYSIAEAVTFVPGVRIKETQVDGKVTGRTLVGVR